MKVFLFCSERGSRYVVQAGLELTGFQDSLRLVWSPGQPQNCFSFSASVSGVLGYRSVPLHYVKVKIFLGTKY